MVETIQGWIFAESSGMEWQSMGPGVEIEMLATVQWPAYRYLQTLPAIEAPFYTRKIP